MRLRIILTLSALWLVIPLFGQTQPPSRQYQIDRAAFSLFPPPDFYMNVWFTDRLADTSTLNESNIQVSTTPNHTLQIVSGTHLSGSRKAIQIVFAGSPPADVTDAKVCFQSLTFLDAQGKNHDTSNVCSSLEVETTSSIASQHQQALDDLKKVPKTSQEKNIFASGFVTTASSGSDGGVNLNLNSNDLGVPGLTVFLHMDKTSATGGDPKNFEAAMNFRSVLPFAKRQFCWRWASPSSIAYSEAFRVNMGILAPPRNSGWSRRWEKCQCNGRQRSATGKLSRLRRSCKGGRRPYSFLRKCRESVPFQKSRSELGYGAALSLLEGS